MNTTEIFKTDIIEEVDFDPDKIEEASTKFYNEIDKILEFIKNNRDKFNNITDELIDKVRDKIEFDIYNDKKNPITKDNWMSCKSRNDLKSLKINELKNILNKEGICSTGKKDTLIDRVYKIKDPSHKFTDKFEDNRRKKKNIKHNKLNKDDFEIMKTFDMTTIYFDLNNKITNADDLNSIQYKLYNKYGWVFKDNVNEYEFIGIKNDSPNNEYTILCECKIPPNLKELLMN